LIKYRGYDHLTGTLYRGFDTLTGTVSLGFDPLDGGLQRHYAAFGKLTAIASGTFGSQGVFPFPFWERVRVRVLL